MRRPLNAEGFWQVCAGTIAIGRPNSFERHCISSPFGYSRMADGRAFEAARRDFVAMSPSGRTVIVYESDESYGILDLLLMSELQVSNAKGQSG
jgi:hypothetical protein